MGSCRKRTRRKTSFFIMTRKVRKSVMCTAVMAVLVLLAMGIDEVFADHETDRLLEDFGDLLDGVESSLLTTQGEIEPAIDESATIPTEIIDAQIAYLKAFDDVIQKQII